MSRVESSVLELDLPLPNHQAAKVLHGQILRYLLKNRPTAGDPLFTESQLTQKTGLSRSTIRRALSPLESQGWIERRQGSGTFVGPRVGLAQQGDPFVTDLEPVSNLSKPPAD